MTTKRFLFALWDGGGNVPPALGIASRLLGRGHVVHVLGDPTLEPEVRAAGCGFTAWTTAPHIRERGEKGALIRDWEQVGMLDAVRRHMDGFLAAPAPRWAADTDAALKEQRPDVFVHDWALPAATIPVDAKKIPRAALMPNTLVVPVRGIPPMGPGLRPARGPLGWLRDALLRTAIRRMFDKALPPLNETRAAYGLPPVQSTFDLMIGPRMYVLTSPEFDFTSPHLPPEIRYAGPVLDDPSWVEPWRSPWPAEDARPLVLVSLSSTFQNQGDALRRIVEALATLPVRALVTLGPVIAPDEVPGRDNVAVVRTAPHAEVLRHASALVTHAGHGTLIKGLCAGVPVVCLPMGRDQDDGAARVEVRQVGVRLKQTARPDRIAAAVRAVLNGGGYRERAAALGQRIRDGAGCVDIVAELEAPSPASG